MRLLRLLGFKFTTVSKALESNYGRFCCLTFDTSHRDLYHQVYPWLESQKISATLLIATDEIGSMNHSQKGLEYTQSPTRITWKNVRYLAAKNWEIGTLGRRKVNLIEMSYKDQLDMIQTARNLITQRLGSEPKVYAYPKGAYDTTSIKCLRICGFKNGLSLKQGINFGQDNTYHLRRVTINSKAIADVLRVVKLTFRKSNSSETIIHGHQKEPSRKVVS